MLLIKPEQPGIAIVPAAFPALPSRRLNKARRLLQWTIAFGVALGPVTSVAVQARTPITTTDTERAFNADMDAAIAPVLATSISKEDAAALKKAFKVLRKKDARTATALRAQIRNPLARKLIDWDRLRRGLSTRVELERFIAENPHWPNQWRLAGQLERKLLTANDASAAMAAFNRKKPETPLGKAALALAYDTAGRNSLARSTASQAWREGDFDNADEEALFLERSGRLLSADDHVWRLRRLLTTDRRWRASRKRHAAVIRRQMKRVSKQERQKAEARLAVFLRSKSAGRKLARLPDAAASDWSLAYHRIQFLRRSKRHKDAATLLLSAPLDTASIVNPDAWWTERRVNAYIALNDNNPKLAYELVKDAGELTVNPYKEQQFKAGWLALRYLDQPQTALEHFKRMAKAADGPLSRSKSDYWLARTYEALGQNQLAKEHYRRSATIRDTFHGQLSRQILGGREAMTISIEPPDRPTPDQIRAFRNRDDAKAAIIAEKAGLGPAITRPFFANLANTGQTEAEVALAAHLTRATDDTQQSLRIGKKAIARGYNLIYYAYPLHAFPKYKPLTTPPETAFLLSVARQESEFNTKIVSGAGARGILQVMKVTARHVCRDYKIRCNYRRLLTDESYNTRIASAYIADRMGEFSGSYILGLTSYNAGPGRSRQWIRQFGDPRSARMDPMDWIERIPFKETRAYVQKVLSNIQVYRARLAQSPSLTLYQDLRRAKKKPQTRIGLVAPGGKVPRKTAVQ